MAEDSSEGAPQGQPEQPTIQQVEEARNAAMQARDAAGNVEPKSPIGFDSNTKLFRTTEYRKRQVPAGMNPDTAGIYKRMDVSRFAEVGKPEIGAPLPLFSSEEIKYIQENGEIPAETKARVRQEADVRAGTARMDYKVLVMEEVASAAFPKAFANEVFGLTPAELADQYMYDTARANDANYRAVNPPAEPNPMNVYTQNHMERANKISEELSKMQTPDLSANQ